MFIIIARGTTSILFEQAYKRVGTFETRTICRFGYCDLFLIHQLFSVIDAQTVQVVQQVDSSLLLEVL